MDELLFFRKNAIESGLCKEWNDKWTACNGNKERLMELVLMQQSAPYFADFCYRNLGLTPAYCKRNFGEYINGNKTFIDCDNTYGYTYAMYVEPDTTEPLTITNDVLQLLWCRDLTAILPMCRATKLYVSNKSNVTISGDGYNTIIVMLFDESKVTLDNIDDTSRVIVYRYSPNASVELGKFFICHKFQLHDKELKL